MASQRWTLACLTGLALLAATTVVLFRPGTLDELVVNDGTVWKDCGDVKATMHFTSVSSTSPVHYGEHQVINKTVVFDTTYTKVVVSFRQYYRLFGKWWVRFLNISEDACAEHPALCNAQPGVPVHVTTRHPKLSPATPFGTYRSNQRYYDGVTGDKIGCVDLQVAYVP